MPVERFGKCACGHRFPIPDRDAVKQQMDEKCDNPSCKFLNRCIDCKPSNFLGRYSDCDCDSPHIIRRWERPIDDSKKAGYGLKGVHRIPKGERWNHALGEYCRTTADVEKYRKQQNKVYVPARNGDPPKPYRPKSCQKASKKRKSLIQNNSS